MSTFDVVVDGGTIIDGTGSVGQLGAIAIRDGLIAAIGHPGEFSAKKIINAKGCVTSPGFIDAHSNLSWGLFVDPACRIAVHQGVTTVVTGNCGGSAFPNIGQAASWNSKAGSDYGVDVKWTDLRGYADAVPPLTLDVAPMVGHGTLRASVCGFDNKPLTAEQSERLKSLTTIAFDQGAIGISFGLAYPPGTFATSEELLACCELAADRGKVCCFHIRIESDELEKAVGEVVELAKESGAATVICHHKALGKRNWGKTLQTIETIDEAKKRGVRIYLDLYPYTTALRNLSMLLPDWAHEGGRHHLVERLRNEKVRGELADALRTNAEKWDASWSDTLILEATESPEIEGRSAADIVAAGGEEALLTYLQQNNGRILTLYGGSSEEDLERVARHEASVVGSDGNAQHILEKGHPRSFATFPRFLRNFVFQKHVLSLEAAVRKMTGLPAELFGLHDRGVLAVGKRADICVFSRDIPEVIANTVSGLAKPWPVAVLGNGQVIVESGVLAKAFPGCVQTGLRE